MLHTYTHRRNEVKIKVDSALSFIFGENVQPLNGLKWLKSFVDCYGHTMKTLQKLLFDVMGLSNSCNAT